MLSTEFMRNALLAGTSIALACGVSGWFVVLRGQLFAGDALSHVAFPGALAAAAAGIDQRAGLFAATVAGGVGLGALGRREPAEDTVVGVAFTFILGVGVFFLALFATSAHGGSGVTAARTLFGSIFGLGAGEARLAAALAAGATLLVAGLSRPLLFGTVAPEVAAARGVRTRALDICFVAILGVVAAEAVQAVGALLLLGLLAAPAAAAHRLARQPLAGIALAALLSLGAVWGGLALAYLIPALPPSTAIVGLAVGAYALAWLSTIAS